MAACASAYGHRMRAMWTLLVDGPNRNSELPLDSAGDGWCEMVVARAKAGTRYRFRIDGDLVVPDPPPRFSRRTCTDR